MKSDNPKISVIVPVYNAEKYLRRCIDSILNQTFTDFEVLLINDGSTDSSGVICDEYAKQDSRIRVFHKENGGVSSARNVGIQNMKGEYSIHCDSDDYVDISMYELLYAKAKEGDLDVTWCDFFRVNEKGNQTVLSQEYIEDPKECIKGLLIGKIHGSTWNKLIKNSLIRNNNISFPRGINMWEDLCFSIQCLMYSSRIGYVNKPLYSYCYNRESICNSIKSSYINDKMKVVDLISNSFKNSGCEFEELLQLKSYVKFVFLSSSKDLSKEKWHNLYPEISRENLLGSFNFFKRLYINIAECIPDEILVFLLRLINK